jgi:hypothetical protein
MSNPLRDLRPIDCTPAVFHSACGALGLSGVRWGDFWRKVEGSGWRVVVWANEGGMWSVAADKGDSARRADAVANFITLGPAIDCALRLVAERASAAR